MLRRLSRGRSAVAASAPPVPPTAPAAPAWTQLPALAPTVGAPPLTADTRDFARNLGARRPAPTHLRPPEHAVHADRGGRIQGIATAVARHPAASPEPVDLLGSGNRGGRRGMGFPWSGRRDAPTQAPTLDPPQLSAEDSAVTGTEPNSAAGATPSTRTAASDRSVGPARRVSDTAPPVGPWSRPAAEVRTLSGQGRPPAPPVVGAVTGMALPGPVQATGTSTTRGSVTVARQVPQQTAQPVPGMSTGVRQSGSIRKADGGPARPVDEPAATGGGAGRAGPVGVDPAAAEPVSVRRTPRQLPAPGVDHTTAQTPPPNVERMTRPDRSNAPSTPLAEKETPSTRPGRVLQFAARALPTQPGAQAKALVDAATLAASAGETGETEPPTPRSDQGGSAGRHQQLPTTDAGQPGRRLRQHEDPPANPTQPGRSEAVARATPALPPVAPSLDSVHLPAPLSHRHATPAVAVELDSGSASASPTVTAPTIDRWPADEQTPRPAPPAMDRPAQPPRVARSVDLVAPTPTPRPAGGRPGHLGLRPPPSLGGVTPTPRVGPSQPTSGPVDPRRPARTAHAATPRSAGVFRTAADAITHPLLRSVDPTPDPGVDPTPDPGEIAVQAGVAARAVDGSVVFAPPGTAQVARQAASDTGSASAPSGASTAMRGAAPPLPMASVPMEARSDRDLAALADELYDRLELRLRSDLLLERERRGALPDV